MSHACYSIIMKLTLVRRGETIENAHGIIQGHLPGSLSDTGIEQATVTADLLKGDQFDAIYCSDLQRCVQTATILRRHHRSTPYSETVQLRERSCGTLQGKKYDEQYWLSLPGSYETRKYPDGESWSDVRVRLIPYLNSLFVRQTNEHILLVTHGGPVRIISSLLTGIPLAEIDKEGTPNAGIWRQDMNSILKVLRT